MHPLYCIAICFIDKTSVIGLIVFNLLMLTYLPQCLVFNIKKYELRKKLNKLVSSFFKLKADIFLDIKTDTQLTFYLHQSVGNYKNTLYLFNCK